MPRSPALPALRSPTSQCERGRRTDSHAPPPVERASAAVSNVRLVRSVERTGLWCVVRMGPRGVVRMGPWCAVRHPALSFFSRALRELTCSLSSSCSRLSVAGRTRAACSPRGARHARRPCVLFHRRCVFPPTVRFHVLSHRPRRLTRARFPPSQDVPWTSGVRRLASPVWRRTATPSAFSTDPPLQRPAPAILGPACARHAPARCR